jgi:OmpA-OmpF porin, OOP family
MLDNHRRYEKAGDMADSLLTSLYSLLDPRTVGVVADSLDISDVSSLKGFKSGITVVLAGVVAKRGDEHALRTMLALSPTVPGFIYLARFTTETSDPNSLTISTGKRVLSIIFGDLQGVVIKAVAVTSGIQADAASRILTMAAPMVVSVIADRVRTEGLSMHGLQDLLERESDGIRDVLPGGLEYLLPPSAGGTSSPVKAGLLQRKRPADWLQILTLVVLMPLVIWFFSHARKTAIRTAGPVQSESKALSGANRPATTKPPVSGVADRIDIDPVDVVRRLLLNKVDLRFDTGSATLQSGLHGQLDMIAETMAAYPDVHVTLTGHTDDAGDAAANRRLARRRANTVMAQLIRKGVPPDHLSSETESTPTLIGDNFTEEGRAKNRCVTLEVSPH